jgi:hypothetical protein
MDLKRSQRIADRQIRKFGRGSQAFLVRSGVSRPCVAARSEYKVVERGLFADGTERFLISALGLQVPPDFELDQFDFKGVGQPRRRYRITATPLGPRPNGIVMFYDCNCMFVSVV